MRLPFVPAGMQAKAWPPVLAARGPGMRSALHSHHCLHFALAIEGELRIRTEASGRWTSAAGVLTASHEPHAIDSQGVEVVLVFFDPESEAGATFRPALDRPVVFLSAELRDALIQDADPLAIIRSGAKEWVRSAARVLRVPPPASQRTIHPRVRKLLAVLRKSGVDDDTSLDALADSVGLSPSRLMHVFTTSIGLPLRQYLAWLATSLRYRLLSRCWAFHAIAFVSSSKPSCLRRSSWYRLGRCW
jgi:hypothetical protein